jgi:1,2-phenylacetyl-CoA epoxidase PaaB subunit
MSKLRQHPELVDPDVTDAAPLEAESDLLPYVVFTQLVPNGPFVYAGWLDAADDAMAVGFACEHYGQDQKCVGIWVAPRRFVAGLRTNEQAAEETVPRRAYRIFTQANAGQPHRSAEIVEADCAADALRTARAAIPGAADMHSVWAIPRDEIVATEPGAMIWRHTDQTYRLARGYSKDVREKWEKVRERQALEEYERDDLEESF